MFSFIKNYFSYKKDCATFRDLVMSSLDTQQFTDLEKVAIKTLEEKLKPEDRDQVKEEALNIYLPQFFTDGKITKSENDQLEKTLTFLSFDITKREVWKNYNYNVARMRGHVADGELIAYPKEMINLNFDESETLYFLAPFILVKKKKVTERINYSHLSHTIKITKGLRYKVGTIKPQVIQSEVLAPVDVGQLWITNERIGFKGENKNIAIDFKKVAFIELDDNLLKLAKDGNANPFLFHSEQIDTVCGIVSLIMNGEYKVIDRSQKESA